MAAHNDTGKEGEELAVAWLQEQGYTIHARNWRCGQYELDLVALKNKTLHFVEVKTRKSIRHGFPEESVTRAKLKNLVFGAEGYLRQRPHAGPIQFDVLAIIIQNDQVSYFLNEDLYL